MNKQLLLVFLMLLPMAAYADDSGSCGDNLTWTFVESTGTLTISGSGAMTDFANNMSIPWYAYINSLEKVIIENGVTTIGENAFYGCALSSINIPQSVTSIGIGAFSSCSSLTSITVASGNSKYDSRNNCNAIIETNSKTLMRGCLNTVIPNNVTKIGDYAFSDCVGLTSINIPNTVTSIGNGAFDGCI